jgi:hypothetical protein
MDPNPLAPNDANEIVLIPLFELLPENNALHQQES